MARQSKTRLDSSNPLLRRLYPVAVDIFSRGVGRARRGKLVSTALVGLATLPLGWPIEVLSRLVQIVILLAVWWGVRDWLAPYPGIEEVLLTLGFVAIFYESIRDQVVLAFLLLATVMTGGGVLRWMCRGRVERQLVREQLMQRPDMEQLILIMIPALPSEETAEYNRLMNLYLASGTPEGEEKFLGALKDYEGIGDKARNGVSEY